MLDPSLTNGLDAWLARESQQWLLLANGQQNGP